MGDKKKKKSSKELKKYYLIDYENVHRTGIDGILNLNTDDNVVIFYSGNADKITFSLHKQILGSKADITYFEVRAGGKNALDFQLSSYMGYIIGSKKNCRFYIVSNDKGFEYVRDFWKKRGVRIEIISNIEDNKTSLEIPEKSSVEKVSPDDELKNVLQDMKLKNEDIEFVKNLVASIISDTSIALNVRKIRINNELCKKFGSIKTKDIYAKLKLFLK